MMKNILLTLTLSLSTIVCSAQDKGFLCASLGSSIPIGDFASADPNNKSAGFAKTGLVFDLSFGYKFSKYIGMAALVRGQANATDAQALANYTIKQIPDATSVTVNSGAWTVSGYMVGGYGSFPISKKISFESKILFGFLTATSPDFTINVTTTTASVWVKEHSASSSTFSYLLSAGFRENVGNHFCFIFNFDYLGANPEFVDVVTNTSGGDRSLSTFSQQFGTINTTFGLGYRFASKSLSLKDL